MNACATGSHGNISIMWKTVSEDCNLACDYCYYSTCGGKPGPKINRIDSGLLEKLIQDYMENSKGTVSFAWQGGEPLLAGLDFFEEAVSLQARHAPPNTSISNALQTNATLLNDRWAQFFKTYHFLLGVSLDGPQEIHDARRKDARGQGSYERVMKGIGVLRRWEVDFNILTVIHKGNVRKGAELMAFYEREGFDYVQLIPCMDFRSQEADQPGIYEITAAEYGDFLCEIFDIWYNGGSPRQSVRFFDNMLSVYARREAELCIHRASCPDTLILEQNGDAYPCDFYIHPEWKLGNVGTHTIAELLAHPAHSKFKAMKPALPEPCRTCEWKQLCHGGCPRNRKFMPDSPDLGVDYFCAAYKQIYQYAAERMRELGKSVRRQQFDNNVIRFFKGRLPERNDYCPCGSGKKYKHCCLMDQPQH